MSQVVASNTSAQSAKRVVIYFVLLFFFMFLTGQLLSELAAQYNLEKFSRVNLLIQSAFDYWKNFDEVVTALFALLLSFVFSLPVAWIYTLSKADEEYDSSLVQTLVVLTMVVTGVMIVVGDVTARAFSLVGVVAAVRFRNTLKDTKDAVYIFISVALGMACGFGVYHIAVWLSVVMSFVMYLLWKFKFGHALREAAVAVKGNKKVVQRVYEQTTATSVERAEQTFERQLRLRQWADLASDKEKKKPNAAFVIEVGEATKAQSHVDSVLAQAGGKWQLANLRSDTPGRIQLEYVGRIPKETTPAALLAAVRAEAQEVILSVEYVSLKGMKSGRSKATEASEDDD